MYCYHSLEEALDAEEIEYRDIKHVDGTIHSVGLEKRLWGNYEHVIGLLFGRKWKGLEHVPEEELCKRVAESLANSAKSGSGLTFELSFKQHVTYAYWCATGHAPPTA